MRRLALIAIVLMVISCGTNATVKTAEKPDFENWPVLKRYDSEHIARIALPLGGIGTGNVTVPAGKGDVTKRLGQVQKRTYLKNMEYGQDINNSNTRSHPKPSFALKTVFLM